MTSFGVTDVIGGSGDDVLLGFGTGRLTGGGRNDTYRLGLLGRAIELEGGGTDTVLTRSSSLLLGANVENLIFDGTGGFRGSGNALANVITGAAGADTLRGQDGDDSIEGGAGGDTIDGGIGFDQILGEAGDDILTAGGPASFPFGDKLYGGKGFDRLTGSGNGALSGGEDDDVLIAGVGDTMLGDEGADTLIGTVGFQLLKGGIGDDQLSGGADADRFEFVDGWGADRITDFQIGLDRIDMTAVTGLDSYFQLSRADDGAGGTRVAFLEQTITVDGVAPSALTDGHFLV